MTPEIMLEELDLVPGCSLNAGEVPRFFKGFLVYQLFIVKLNDSTKKVTYLAKEVFELRSKMNH